MWSPSSSRPAKGSALSARAASASLPSAGRPGTEVRDRAPLPGAEPPPEGRRRSGRGTPEDPPRAWAAQTPGRSDEPRARARARRTPLHGDARLHRGQSRGRSRMGARGATGGRARLSATAVLLVPPVRPLLYHTERVAGVLLNRGHDSRGTSTKEARRWPTPPLSS